MKKALLLLTFAVCLFSGCDKQTFVECHAYIYDPFDQTSDPVLDEKSVFDIDDQDMIDQFCEIANSVGNGSCDCREI